mgnify:FL=1
MKIKKIKINSYGKLKNKEIDLKNNINIIYGKNESGKSTLLKFILNIFYGTSKNKKGKDISDFEKYKPWDSEEFSGKLLYELDDKNNYEIFREFNKKNPIIFNENGEDITKKFNIDKNKGCEFFFEQTQITEEMFLSTSVALQQEVKIGKENQSMLIQRISNLLGTGEDNISFKKAMDKINKKQLEEVGTERSKEKPINIIQKNIKNNEEKINELKKYENLKYEFEEKRKEIKNNLEKNETENNLLKEIKKINEKNNLENEKIKINEKIIQENKNKIKELENKIAEKNEEYLNEEKNEKYIDEKYEKNRLKNKLQIIFAILIIINILWIIFISKIIDNIIFKYIFLLTIPTDLIFSIIFKNKLNKKIKKLNKEKNIALKNIEDQKNDLKKEKEIIEKNSKEIEDEVNKIKLENNLARTLEEHKILNKYSKNITEEEISDLFNDEKLEVRLNYLETIISNQKVDLNKIELQKENIEPQLENLSSLEEQLSILNEEHENLKNIKNSIELTKTLLERAYEKMKSQISPIFTEKLSNNIAKITKGKYKNIYFNDEQGLTVELENGNYVPAERLSIGTIDQLYLSLRLAMLDSISNEKVPIILDEAFAYYDNERLKNILAYLGTEFKNRQIIILTCTQREKELLKQLKIACNYIEL